MAVQNEGAVSCGKVGALCPEFTMCQETIETSLKVNGIQEAKWDIDTKIMTVTYDTSKISLDQIHKNIAGVGYDTDKYKSKDSTYANLHECCKYDRK